MFTIVSRQLLACTSLFSLAGTAFAGDLLNPYEPDWANAIPTQVLTFDHDPGLSDVVNGENLKNAMKALLPGQRLEIGSGTYSINSFLNLSNLGLDVLPIWIVAQEGANPVITRPDAAQNLMNIGQPGQGHAQYIVIQGLEFTGGSAGIRMHDCSNIWINQCHVHDTGAAGITANTDDANALYVTENVIHDTGGNGEGMNLGNDNLGAVLSNSVIALNHVYDTGGSQGDGIELQQGSWGNLIARNEVHDTNGVGIIVAGNEGLEPNVVERNICYRTGGACMQVQGDAWVRNNLLMNGLRGFHSFNHQGFSANLRFEHNTVITKGNGARLASWNNSEEMYMVNNVIYSEIGDAIDFNNGSVGAVIAKNVVLGSIHATSDDPLFFIQGNGLIDFKNVDWDGNLRDAVPAPFSAVLNHGNPFFPVIHDVTTDLNGALRPEFPDVGCYERGSYGTHYGEPGTLANGDRPEIRANSEPFIGNSSYTLSLLNGPPNEFAFLCIALDKIELPISGVVLWQLPFEVLIQVTDFQGSAAQLVPIPFDLEFPGIPLRFQWITTAPPSPPWSYSDGLDVTMFQAPEVEE